MDTISLTFVISFAIGAASGIAIPYLGIIGECVAVLAIFSKFMHYWTQIQSGDIAVATAALTNFTKESLMISLGDYLTASSLGYAVGFAFTMPYGFKFYGNILSRI
ncbi:hypothetical protein MMKA1_08170 [Methanococcus maripaludis KA1]|jgi:hypothetical protein|uniref:Uncharacterized protein n=1 Tax=Methanococcus maripaludis KA1 TaxID=637914 RepID=A0A2Z5PMI3_METMI|nr:hypothetical protein [Methanococcus maripaludis]BAP60934.1 hypothetical protein MMKA1_08170 [Methanococcus maripaludis KA1]